MEEICVEEPGPVFVVHHGCPGLTTTVLPARRAPDLVEPMLRISGRRVNLSTPFANASPPTGARPYPVIPQATG